MLGRLPLMMWGIFYLAIGSYAAEQYFWLAGVSMIIVSLSILQKRKQLLPRMDQLVSLLGIGSLMVFFAGFIIGASFLFGPYSIGTLTVEPVISQFVGFITVMLSVVEFSTGK